MSYESRLSLTVDSRSGEQSLKGFRSQLDSTEKSGTKLVTKTRELTNTFGKMAVGVGLAGAALATYYTKQGLAAVDAQAKLARNVNGTYDALSSLKVAFEDSGVDGYDASINRLNRRLGAAEQGGGAAAGAVKALNLDLEALSKMDVDERIASIADSIRDSGASAQQAARHAQDLGFEQQSAGAFFLQGGDAIRSYRKEIDEFGLSISELDTIKIEQANDEFAKTGRLIEGASNQMAVQLAPVLSALSQLFVNTAKEAGGMDKVVETAFNKVIDGAAFAIDAGQGLVRVFKVAGKGIAVAMAQAQVNVLTLAKAILDGPVDAANALIRGMNRFGASIKEIEENSLSKALGAQITLAKGIVKEGLADIQDTLLEPIDAGQTFKRLVSEAQDAADEAAQTVLDGQALVVKKYASNYEKAGEDAGKKFKDGIASQAKSIADSLQDAITQGNWAGVGATVGGALAGGIAGAVTQHFAGRMGESIAASIAAPMFGALVGGLAGLAFNKIGGLFSRDDYDPAAERQAAQGAGTVLGDINAKTQSISKSVAVSASATSELVGINRGMLEALRSTQAGIKGASGRVASEMDFLNMQMPSFDQNLFNRNFATKMVGESFNAMGSLVTLGLFNGLGDTLGKALGGKTKETDRGIHLTGGSIGGVMYGDSAYAYLSSKSKSWAGGSYKHSTDYERLSADAQSQFQAVYRDIYKSVGEGLEVFGMDIAEMAKGFTIDATEISFKGMNAEQKTAALESHFSKVFDDLTKHTFAWASEFQLAGEGQAETLTRIATNMQATREAADQLGFSFGGLTEGKLVLASEQLIEFADGMENLISGMKGFVANFASEARQFEIAQGELQRAFDRTSMSLPATREGYYDLMQMQDASTESGAKNIAALLRLQGAADSYYSSLEEQARKATDLQIEQARKAADAQISLIREQADAQGKIMRESMAMTRSALSVAQAAASAVDNALLGLQGTAASSSKLRRDSALTMLQQMASSGKIGDNLGGALTAATNINMNEFSSFDDYIREVARTGAVLTDLKQVTDKQVSREEALLESIEKRLEAMQRDSNDRQAAIAKNTASTVTLLTRQEVGANA